MTNDLMDGLSVITGNEIKKRLADLELILSLGPLKDANTRFLRERLVPNLGRHYVFLGNDDYAIAHEAAHRYLPLNCPKDETTMHIWYASTPEIVLPISDYLSKLTPKGDVSLQVRNSQVELEKFAVSKFKFIEKLHSAEYYNTRVLRQ